MAKYMARGWSGLRKGGKLQADVEAKSDAAKKAARRKKLEQVTADNLRRVQRGKKPRTVSKADIERRFRASQSIDRQIRHYQGKVAEMRDKARKVEESKTGNVKARDTYLQTAKEYQKKIKALQARKK